MSRSQKLLLAVVSAAFILSLVYLPWRIGHMGVTVVQYRTWANRERHYASVDGPRLLTEWVLLGIAGVMGYQILRKRGRDAS